VVESFISGSHLLSGGGEKGNWLMEEEGKAQWAKGIGADAGKNSRGNFNWTAMGWESLRSPPWVGTPFLI